MSPLYLASHHQWLQPTSDPVVLYSLLPKKFLCTSRHTQFKSELFKDQLYFCCCSVAKSCLTLWSPKDCSMPGFPVFHYLPELAQTHVHWVSDAIQPSHPLSSPSPLALNLSQHQGLFRWVGSLHHVAKGLELPMNIQGWFLLEWTGLINCTHFPSNGWNENNFCRLWFQL